MDKLCEFEGCELPRKAKNLCPTHYRRLQRHGHTGIIRKPRGVCSLEGCERLHTANGYCMPHYRRVREFGDPGPVEIRKMRPGATRYHNSRDGYVRVKVDSHPRASKGWIREHLLVMEEKMGRFLAPGEEVHHINGVKHDNRPENLELWVVSQPKGQRPDDLVNWAHEILRRYGDCECVG